MSIPSEIYDYLAVTCSRIRAEGREPTFEEIWALFLRQGYQYGPEQLANVRFGWNIMKAVQGTRVHVAVVGPWPDLLSKPPEIRVIAHTAQLPPGTKLYKG